jgi:NAD(P)H-dependent flavin oxidoreductase YrpB (nitropropane dioxygenase family)
MLLETDLPVIAAPMAGGATTPELVVAAARAGSLGFLAGGYLQTTALAQQLSEVRSAGVPFAVNLFPPGAVQVDEDAFRAYAREIEPEASALGVDLATGAPVQDDDSWQEKLALLLEQPPPLVSFTFAIPPAPDLRALQRAGSTVVQTVTSAREALAAADAGVDALMVQSSRAGGHHATLTPAYPDPAPGGLPELIEHVRTVTRLPLIAAGGVAASPDVTAAIAAGAEAVAVGTALLLAHESGTAATHRSALLDPARTQTVITRAFTGRPARGLRNAFIERHEKHAPLGYPAVHHLTSPLRRAAAAAGDAERLHLWAGTGHRSARAEPAAAILIGLAA